MITDAVEASFLGWEKWKQAREDKHIPGGYSGVGWLEPEDGGELRTRLHETRLRLRTWTSIKTKWMFLTHLNRCFLCKCSPSRNFQFHHVSVGTEKRKPATCSWAGGQGEGEVQAQAGPFGHLALSHPGVVRGSSCPLCPTSHLLPAVLEPSHEDAQLWAPWVSTLKISSLLLLYNLEAKEQLKQNKKTAFRKCF